MEYVTSEFSNVPYTINSKLGINNFKIKDNATSIVHTVVIQEGNYSGQQLAQEIRAQLTH